jgi:hypothetical protein
MTRFLTAALLTPPPRPVPLLRNASAERAYVASLLCRSLTTHTGDVRVHRAARVADATRLALLGRYLGSRLTVPGTPSALCYARADEIHTRVKALAEADRVPVLVAVVRDLLDGAPDCCEELDRAWRDLVAARQQQDERVEAMAAEVLR